MASFFHDTKFNIRNFMRIYKSDSQCGNTSISTGLRLQLLFFFHLNPSTREFIAKFLFRLPLLVVVHINACMSIHIFFSSICYYCCCLSAHIHESFEFSRWKEKIRLKLFCFCQCFAHKKLKRKQIHRRIKRNSDLKAEARKWKWMQRAKVESSNSSSKINERTKSTI